MSRKKLVPKLRFPEFRDDAEWNIKLLEEIAKLIEDKAGKNKHILMSVTAGIGLVSQIEKFGREIAGEQYKNYYVIKKGDFAYNKSSTKQYPEGYIAILEHVSMAALPNSIFTCFRIIDNTINKKFLDCLFQFNYHGNWLRRIITVGARAHGSLNVNTNEFFQMPIYFPKLDEQQKIADCLSSLDELITAHSKKLETLKEYKKGLMQQLFPAEGETQPKLRFPEFKKAEKWEEVTLGKVTTYFKGFAFKSIDYTVTGRRIVRVSDMGYDYIKDEKNAIYIDRENANKFKRWMIQEGDLIITTVGSKPPVYNSLVGRSIVVQNKDNNSLLNQNAVCLRTKQKTKQIFLNQLIKRKEYISYIESIIRGNANQGSIALTDLFRYKFRQPSLQEQQKIATCLSSIDEQINTQSQKIEALKLHKKGLMQQLFPSPEDIRK